MDATVSTTAPPSATGTPRTPPPAASLAERSFVARNPSVPVFLALLLLFTIAVSVMSEALGLGLISTSLVKTLGK
ncbi:MAG: hypothetical protein KDJ41_12425, partial [Hyphomicrobiaceae bacterium]|nr:hypothetical protein [Hyphomicrobiaceae bacterium]